MDLIDFILHIDQHLNDFIIAYDSWIYVILFLIIFVETGVVVMPFLPGDSLLFAVGMFAAQGSLNIWICLVLLLAAAILGDASNYLIGKYLGPKMLKLRWRGKQLIKPQYLDKTHEFYEKHGAKTIVIARFVPIVRTFAPFVAGIGKMNYWHFLSYNVIGGVLWIVGLTLAGYFLGSIPFIKDNFEIVVFVIIFLSLLPMLFEYLKTKRQAKANRELEAGD
ncbi:DedA family protein [Haoranjiania flava]|uniref:DedA family protein n=1 Tax=Haoranjiania flava TaxID=1856322 RepID=A0AAE3LJ26_9BACT|nr:DedA family protein [Haoranjiania flava]MCU7693178.1 DedA family protein [Haoranjiania flava]